MQKLSLSSKARTLESLTAHLSKAGVLPLIRFSVGDYENNRDELLKQIGQKFQCKVIVRSSSQNEDNEQTSNAGGFDSIMNVESSLPQDLNRAIQSVIDSYGNKVSTLDEVFVQPMLENVEMSGVVFSADMDTLSSYYIVNYDESGSTDSVTSGHVNGLKTFISFRDNTKFDDDRLEKLIIATKECETIFDNEYLDIEFAYAKGKLYILQVRAIVKDGKNNLANIDLSQGLRKLHKKIAKLNAKHPNLLGDRTIFGVMPDWNPAEIIGVRPKRLALSLYKELITDETWAYQRDNYGYRNLRSHPLLISFLGVPYVDVRISFNSFVPKELDDGTAKKLVNSYLEKLAKNKNHHDKVEFEIIHSCYYFGVGKHLNKLKEDGFCEEEIEDVKNSLLNLTNDIINPNDGLYKKDLEKVEILKHKYKDITTSDLSLIDKIYWLIKDVKRYGTLPFAGVARAGFVAVQFLKSFVEEKIITQEEYDLFLNSLNTVSKQLSKDLNTCNKDEFLDVYGHLRPGTYDILSERYDEAYDYYFSVKNSHSEEAVSFEFSELQKKKINNMIKEHGLKSSYEELMVFIKESIEGREYAKFVFTKSLSQVLRYIAQFGEKFGFSKEDLAYLDIQKIINLYATLDHRDVKDILEVDINKNREFYKYTQAVKLPGVIVGADDIYHFFLEEDEANFITLKYAKAELICEKDIAKMSLENKIICIKSADPGYDYLFSKNIGGLITCYGGANSHMAIRCAEMGIPAVIGCGEQNFNTYSRAGFIEIDAANKRVTVLA